MDYDGEEEYLTWNIENFSGPQIERKMKNITEVFKGCGLSTIVTTNIIPGIPKKTLHNFKPI